MITLRSLIVTLCVSLVFCAALERPNEDHSSRAKKSHLSDEDHFVDEQHNLDYDHEAFLGEEEARDFDQMTPEESISSLKKIVDKIDKDEDGFVTEEELRKWIAFTQKKYITDDTNAQWKTHNPDNKDKITWQDYEKITYGFMQNMDPKDLEDDEEGTSYLEMKRRDERRWKLADLDSDGSLSFEEFMDFLHPEEATHMKEIVVTETLEDVDKDKDGKISLEEYIGDMYKEELDGTEPDWVNSEKQQFEDHRDADKSGFMEVEEVRAWIMPAEYDMAGAEAKHLISEADENGDGKLTKDEIVDKYDLFVGSQATDFGEAIGRHDEF